MGSPTVEHIVWRVLTDPVFRAQLMKDRKGALRSCELSTQQLESLDRMDMDALAALACQADKIVDGTAAAPATA